MTARKSPTTPATILMAQIRRAKKRVVKEKNHQAALHLQRLQQRYREVTKLRIVDDDFVAQTAEEMVA